MKEPKKPGAFGAKVARSAPAARGNVIMPPGTRSTKRLIGMDISAGLALVDVRRMQCRAECSTVIESR